MLFPDQLKTDTNGISVSSFELLNTKPGTYAFATNEALTQLVE